MLPVPYRTFCECAVRPSSTSVLDLDAAEKRGKVRCETKEGNNSSKSRYSAFAKFGDVHIRKDSPSSPIPSSYNNSLRIEKAVVLSSTSRETDSRSALSGATCVNIVPEEGEFEAPKDRDVGGLSRNGSLGARARLGWGIDVTEGNGWEIARACTVSEGLSVLEGVKGRKTGASSKART